MANLVVYYTDGTSDTVFGTTYYNGTYNAEFYPNGRTISAVSVYGGYGISGEGGAYVGGIQINAPTEITISVSTAKTLFFNVDNSNPITYTNIMGNTRTVKALNPINIYNGQETTTTIVPFEQPTLTENGTLGGSKFAVSCNSGGINPYCCMDGVGTSTYFQGSTNSYASPTVENPQYIEFYNPNGLNFSQFSIYQMTGNAGQSGYYTNSGTIEVSNDGVNYITATTYTASNYERVVIDVSYQGHYKYTRFTSTGNSYGRCWAIYTLDFVATESIVLDEGIYKVVLPNFGNQPYLFNGNVYFQESEPTTQVKNDVWINPQEPYTAKLYDGTNWQNFNDIILLDSSVTVGSGVITNLIQPKYNSNHIEPKFQNNPQIIETYINGNSGYRVWSDGYCEQWGSNALADSTGNAVTNFLKPFKDTSYTIQATRTNASNDSYYYDTQVHAKYIYGFKLWKPYSNGYSDWLACGYIK